MVAFKESGLFFLLRILNAHILRIFDHVENKALGNAKLLADNGIVDIFLFVRKLKDTLSLAVGKALAFPAADKTNVVYLFPKCKNLKRVCTLCTSRFCRLKGALPIIRSI